MTLGGTPMKSLRRPSAATIGEFLAAQAELDFTYPEVGAMAAVPPAGYVVDRTPIRLGWMEAWPPGAPIRVGEVVGSVSRLLGLWWLNACRIAYVLDEEGPVTRFGFANGTLPGHAGVGEERFLVGWDRAGGEVWYDILAFSRPHVFLSRLGYPYLRRVQGRFGRESAAAM